MNSTDAMLGTRGFQELLSTELYFVFLFYYVLFVSRLLFICFTKINFFFVEIPVIPPLTTHLQVNTIVCFYLFISKNIDMLLTGQLLF